MKGRKTLRRAGIVLGFGALLSAGMLASGALGMVSAVSSGGTDSSSTAADTSSSTTTSADTTGSTTTDATPPPTTTDTTSGTTTTTPSVFTPTISSDKADYSPGATVVLSGHGWPAGESVHINVNDDVGQTWAHDVDVTADAAGSFTDQFTLPDWFVADYTVRAAGSSGTVATTTFSDTAVQNVTVTVSPTTAGVNAAYTIKFTPLTAVPSGDFIQITFPAGTTIPATIAAGNITVNGTAAAAASFAINTSQRVIQFDSPLALPANVQATAVIGAATAVIGNPPAGTYTLQMKTKDDNNQATSANYAIVSSKATTTAVASSANPSTYPASVTFTATVTASPTPNPSSVGSVTFKEGATTLCNAVPLSGNTATCTPSPVLGAGSHSITADYSGAVGFAASSGSITQSVNKGSQTITVTTHAPGSAAYNSTFTVAATGGGSGNAVTFSSAGGCSNVGGLFTMTSGTTNCTVKYDQAGDANYNAATQVTESVNATKANQSITFGALGNKTYGDADFGVSATASSGLAVAFSALGNCTATLGGIVSITGAGSCTIEASQAGDANYNAASSVPQSFTIHKADQVITITTHAPASKVFGGSFTVAATGGGSGNAVSFSNGGGCSNSGATFTMTSGSTDCVVKYDQDGDANYNAAPQKTETVTAVKADQDPLSVTSPDNGTFNQSYDVVTSGGSGTGGVSFDVGSSTACAIVTGKVKITSGTGSCAVSASKASDANYNAANSGAHTVTVHKATQTISFNALANRKLGDPDFAVAATASSGLTVTFSSQTPTVCSISGGTVHILAVGTCTIRASQAGNDNYSAATSVDQSLGISYVFNGFFQPVDNTIWNSVQAGSAIPVKFSLNGNQGLNIFTTGYPKVVTVTCPSAGAVVDAIEETVTANASGLQYDSTAAQYIYVWKTDKAWASSCRRLDVMFADGVTKSALFQFKK